MMAENNKLRSNDRVISLSQIDKKAPISSTGVVDRRLFTGEQKLHAIVDSQSGLWYMQYETVGKLPQELDQKFTTFSALYKHAEEYFRKRNIKIEEVID
jgi:hypothetical protein